MIAPAVLRSLMRGQLEPCLAWNDYGRCVHIHTAARQSEDNVLSGSNNNSSPSRCIIHLAATIDSQGGSVYLLRPTCYTDSEDKEGKFHGTPAAVIAASMIPAWIAAPAAVK